MIIVGIDCGATRTKARAFNDELRPLAYCTSGPANPTSTPKHVVRENILRCLRELREDLGVERFDVVAFSAASTGEGAWRDFYREIVVSEGLAHEVHVFEDYVVAHYACFLGKPGVACIAGTGSSVYAVGSSGAEVKVGGWGHLVDDEGSGYYVGSEGIRAALRCLDGRGPCTELALKLFEYLGISDVRDVVRAIYGSSSPKEVVAGFARYVVEEARRGDEVALSILNDAAREIAVALKAASEAVGVKRYCVLGGLYAASKDVLKPLIEKHLSALLGERIELEEALLTMEEAVARLALEERKRRTECRRSHPDKMDSHSTRT